MSKNFSKRFSDLTGKRFGKALVKDFHSWHVQPSGQKKAKWLCVCDCGKEFVAMGSNLIKKDRVNSCGCERDKRIAEGRKGYFENLIPTDLEGEKIGRLTVGKFSRWQETTESRVSVWNCTCDCGGEVEMRRDYLRTTPVPSCGCYKSEVLSNLRKTHGYSGTPTYKSWLKMKERCDLDSYEEKEYYREKGITYDKKWEVFENFLNDMGERPEGTSLDRIDNSLGYSKGNCRWADCSTQSYNRDRFSSNTSGRTGVYEVEGGAYKAMIGVQGKLISLAYGVSFEDAVKAREEAELKYYGWNKE